jgi:hypothetical protein
MDGASGAQTAGVRPNEPQEKDMKTRKQTVRSNLGLLTIALGALGHGCAAPLEEDAVGEQQAGLTYTECASYDTMTAAMQAAWRERCVEDVITRTGSSQELVDGVPPTPDYKVQYTHSSSLPDYAQALFSHVNGGAMFPGALVHGQDGVMGVLDAPLFAERNLGGQVTVSGVTLEAGASSHRRAPRFDKGHVQDTIKTILEAGAATLSPNTYMTISETVDSKSTLINAKVGLTAVLKMLLIGFDSSMNLERSEDATDLVAQFVQDYYTASVAQPNTNAGGGFFTPDVRPGDLKALGISAFKPMAYVSRVNYGREMYVRFRSHRESEEVKTALSASLDIIGNLDDLLKGGGSGQDGGTGAGDAGTGDPQTTDPKELFNLSISSHTKKVLEETNVVAWSIGGTSAVPGLTALSFIESMLLADPTDPAQPLTPTSYVVNHLQTNNVLQTARVTDFHHAVRNVGRSQTLRIDHKGVYFSNSGDSAGNGDLTGEARLFDQDGRDIVDLGWWDKRSTGDGGRFPGQVVVRTFNLEANPRVRSNFWFQDYNRKLFGGWNPDDRIDSDELYLNWTGNAWEGNLPGAVGDVDRQLSGWMDVGVEPVNPCPEGEGWDLWTCRKKEFTVDHIAAPYGEVCGADTIPVSTHLVFSTSGRVRTRHEDYTINVQRMVGEYPNLTVDPATPVLTETTGMWQSKPHLPANTFVLQHLYSAHNRVLTPGVYRMRISGHGIGDFGERFFKVKPVGVRSTVDTRQDESMLVPANAPLIVDLIDACGSGAYYRLDLARFRNGSWQTIVSGHELQRQGVRGLSLRELANQYNTAIVPGMNLRLTISVLGSDGATWQPYHKYVELEECPAGTAWMGDNCYSVSPTWVRSQASGECAYPADVGSGAQYMQPDVCDGSFAFQVVDFGDEHVGLRTADNRCAQRVDFTDGPLHLRPCTASIIQTFVQRAYNGFVQLEDDESSCVSFSDFLVRDDCSLANHTNRLQFVWTPAARTENIAREASVSAQTTYGGYSAQRVVDGSRNTALGEAHSWSNGGYGTGAPPQWLDLTWPTVRTLGRVDLYTTDTYPMRDYDIQAWSGGAWVTVANVRGNTSPMVSSMLPEVQTDRLRILGRSGPSFQPQHVRINELEVY